jgi:glycosyltransferase involved in cell wall biosynthesis
VNTGRVEALTAIGRARPLLRLLRPVADRVLTVSEPGARAMRELVPGLSVVAVDNAVDVASFPPARPELEPARAVYVGTLARRKGLIDLAAAADQLVAWGGAPLPVEVVGGSNEVGEVEAREVKDVVEAGRGEFTFLGSLPAADVRERLSKAQLFVLPSHEEGQPIAILEAMAAGLPVVVTSIGANPDVVRHGLDGILVPPRDPVRLADALQRLIDDPLLRARMGASAHGRALTLFDTAVLRERLLGEYERAIRSRPRGS